jgi:hypothetical protein
MKEVKKIRTACRSCDGGYSGPGGAEVYHVWDLLYPTLSLP